MKRGQSRSETSSPIGAGTLEQGAWAIRPPIGISGFGITDRTELQVIPYDMMIGGPRVGIEQTLLQKESFTWSIAPSIAEKTWFRQTDLRLSVLLGIENDRNRFGLKMTVNLRMFQHSCIDYPPSGMNMYAYTTARGVRCAVCGARAPHITYGLGCHAQVRTERRAVARRARRGV